MEYVDLFCIAVACFSVGMGFFRGLVWEILKYASFALSGCATFFLLTYIYNLMPQNDSGMWWLIGAGGVSFTLCSVFSLYFVNMLSRKISKTPFSFADKVLGSVFGAARAYVFLALLYAGLMLVTENRKPDWMINSVFIRPLDASSALIHKTVYSLGSKKLNKLLKLDSVNIMDAILPSVAK